MKRWSIRSLVVVAAALGAASAVAVACGSDNPGGPAAGTDGAPEGSSPTPPTGSGEAGGGGSDGGDASTDAPRDTGLEARAPCPAPPANCVVASLVNCPGAADRCIIHCSTAATRPAASAVCGGWADGGCLLGVTNNPILQCMSTVLPLLDASAGVWMDYAQAAGQASPDAGWGSQCNKTIIPAPWLTGDPDDGDGTEDGTENCASVSSTQKFVDRDCTTTLSYLCEVPHP